MNNDEALHRALDLSRISYEEEQRKRKVTTVTPRTAATEIPRFVIDEPTGQVAQSEFTRYRSHSRSLSSGNVSMPSLSDSQLSVDDETLSKSQSLDRLLYDNNEKELLDPLGVWDQRPMEKRTRSLSVDYTYKFARPGLNLKGTEILEAMDARSSSGGESGMHSPVSQLTQGEHISGKVPPPVPPRLEGDYDEANGHKKRYRLFSELVETERTYVEALKTLMCNYRIPSKSLLDKKDYETFFPGHIPYLYEFHKDFLERMTVRLQSFTPESVIGDLFTRLPQEFFNHYAEYNGVLSNMNNIIEAFNKIKPGLDGHGIQPRFDRMTFNGWLLCPTQRLPRYILLLTELAKNTHGSHNDSYFINHAVNLLQRNTSSVNDQVKRLESNVELQQIVRVVKNAPRWLYSRDRYILKEIAFRAEQQSVPPSLGLGLGHHHFDHSVPPREGIMFVLNDAVFITVHRNRTLGSVRKQPSRFDFLKAERTVHFKSVKRICKRGKVAGSEYVEIFFVLQTTEQVDKIFLPQAEVDDVIKFLLAHVERTQHSEEQPLVQV